MKELFTSSDYDALQRQIVEFMENHEVYSWDNVTIVTEKKPTDDNKDYYWQSTLIPKNTQSAIEDLLVEEHGMSIGHFTEKEATSLAIKIKTKLVEMAIEDEIPLDMNELDYSIISGIIKGMTLEQ